MAGSRRKNRSGDARVWAGAFFTGAGSAAVENRRAEEHVSYRIGIKRMGARREEGTEQRHLHASLAVEWG